MDRINNASSVNRRFIDEGNNRTIVPASHLNGLLFEIINVIEGFGGQLNGTEVAQIRTLLEARITSVSERLIEDFNVDEGNISDFAQAIQTILSSTIFDRDQISSSEIRTLVTNTFANFIYEQKVVQVANDSRVYSSSSASSNRYKAAIAFPSDLEFLPRTIFFELRIGTDNNDRIINFDAAECETTVAPTYSEDAARPLNSALKTGQIANGKSYYTYCGIDYINKRIYAEFFLERSGNSETGLTKVSLAGAIFKRGSTT